MDGKVWSSSFWRMAMADSRDGNLSARPVLPSDFV
jgi:hypothetical protein